MAAVKRSLESIVSRLRGPMQKALIEAIRDLQQASSVRLPLACSPSYRAAPAAEVEPAESVAEEALPTLAYAEEFRPGGLPLDRGISYAVKVLRDAGIETFESCQGGEGHVYPEPAVRFYGQRGEGYRAVAVAITYGLPVKALRRYWSVEREELVGPEWEITFWASRLAEVQRDAERCGQIR